MLTPQKLRDLLVETVKRLTKMLAIILSAPVDMSLLEISFDPVVKKDREVFVHTSIQQKVDRPTSGPYVSHAHSLLVFAERSLSQSFPTKTAPNEECS